VRSSCLEPAVRKAHLGLIWGASLLVPAPERSEWRKEWRAELWYVLRECSTRSSAHPRPLNEATAFCLGAYQDAVWLRKRFWRDQRPLPRIWGSPAFCLLLLIGVLCATWEFARLSPRIAAVNEMSRIRVSPSGSSALDAAPSACTFDRSFDKPVPRSFGIPSCYFDGFSHYSIKRDTVSSRSVPWTKWTVAHAPSDFFRVAHLTVRFPGEARAWPPGLLRLVLSERSWLQEFGGSPNIAGTEVRVGSVDAIVAGVAAGGAGNLPGAPNAWLLDSNYPLSADPARFVVGHLSPVGYFQVGPRWVLSSFAMVLAVLLVPFLKHSSLGEFCKGIGEYCKGTHKPSLARRSIFWAFLFVKIAFLLATAYFASVDLDGALVQPVSPLSGALQGVSAFLLCLFGLSWALRDQQQRCPVCLRRMMHPVDVGQPSRTFLAWNGTELLCERGHVLLHVPRVPTSWFSSQRWVCLDPSWQFLFARTGGAPGS